MGWTIRNIIVQMINIILGVAALFIGLRVIFTLTAANAATPFVGWVDQVSDSLISPFRGMFNNPVLDGGRVLDLVALISMLAYALLSYLIIYAFDTILSAVDSRSARI